jgi:hypothetical protein
MPPERRSWSGAEALLRDTLAAHAGLWMSGGDSKCADAHGGDPYTPTGFAWLRQTAPAALLAIVDRLPEPAVIALLAGDAEGEPLRALLRPALPGLRDFDAVLAAVAATPAGDAPPPGSAHSRRDIGGRKLAQIDAFLAASGRLSAPPLDWCAGKGHLGRLLALRDGVPVRCLEREPALCAEGARLARRDGAMVEFSCRDALAAETAAELRGRHVLALHACGELHRRLVADAAGCGLRAVDLAPCCYHRGLPTVAGELLRVGDLAPTASDLRLAVTGHATASLRERRRQLRLLGWQCALRQLARQCWRQPQQRLFARQAGSRNFGSLADWAAPIAVRFGERLPAAAELARFEEAGHREALAVLRLSLVRLAFQRPLEVWLVLRLAVVLEAQGFAVRVRRFCDAALTPRNLLVSARA